MISIIESIAQAENESRSDNIKWGIKQRAAQGTSKLYNRKCYGFSNADDGSLIIEKSEAKNVKLIFNMYLEGKHDLYYLAEKNHPDIITKEMYQAVQIEKQHRSNVVEGEKGTLRKSKKYSSKK